MTETEAIIFVVDDDPEVRISTARLLQSADLKVETFGSAQQFLNGRPPMRPAAWSSMCACPG